MIGAGALTFAAGAWVAGAHYPALALAFALGGATGCVLGCAWGASCERSTVLDDVRAALRDACAEYGDSPALTMLSDRLHRL